MSICVFTVPFWTTATVFPMDSVALFICFYLFQKKINILLNMQSEGNNAGSNIVLMNVLRKYKVLLITVTVSSWILGLIITFSALVQTFSATDTMINIWCLILFDVRYTKLYERVFRCCVSISLSEQENEQNIPSVGTAKTLQMVIH
eukprot:517044_1